MTLNGAIMQLVEMRDNSMMPEMFKPYFDKVIETVSECKEPSAQSEYEPVKAEDFAKTMSENTVYSFMAWHSEALELMERQGFVICKKIKSLPPAQQEQRSFITFDDITLYKCDPAKNTSCEKSGCYVNGGPCKLTRHEEYMEVSINEAQYMDCI